MPDPTAYSRRYNFTGFQVSSPTTPLPADQLDVELDAIATAVAEAVAAIIELRRSDGGALQNGLVTEDALSTAVRAKLGATPAVSTDVGAGAGPHGAGVVLLDEAAGAVVVDVDDGHLFRVNMHAAVALNVANVLASTQATSLTLYLYHYGAARTVDWSGITGLRWAEGSAPILSVAGSKFDIVQLETIDGGTTWFGFHIASDL